MVLRGANGQSRGSQNINKINTRLRGQMSQACIQCNEGAPFSLYMFIKTIFIEESVLMYIPVLRGSLKKYIQVVYILVASQK